MRPPVLPRATAGASSGCGMPGTVLCLALIAWAPAALQAADALQSPRTRSVATAYPGILQKDFGQQEPGQGQQIANFCFNTYGVQFPMFAKSNVWARRPTPVPRPGQGQWHGAAVERS